MTSGQTLGAAGLVAALVFAGCLGSASRFDAELVVMNQSRTWVNGTMIVDFVPEEGSPTHLVASFRVGPKMSETVLILDGQAGNASLRLTAELQDGRNATHFWPTWSTDNQKRVAGVSISREEEGMVRIWRGVE